MNNDYRVCTGEWHKENKALQNMTTPVPPIKKEADSRSRKAQKHDNSLS